MTTILQTEPEDYQPPDGAILNLIAQKCDHDKLEEDIKYIQNNYDAIKLDPDNISLNKPALGFEEDLQPGTPRGAQELEEKKAEIKRLGLKVGIVGSGVAGLYTAMMLDHLNIECEILEASERIGGRVHTHAFDVPRTEPDSDNPNAPVDFKPSLTNDYYDVGAMRFPDIPIMWRTFDLFTKRLGMQKINDGQPQGPEQVGNLIQYKLTGRNNPLFYNERRHTRETLKIAEDNKLDAMGIIDPNDPNSIPKDIVTRGHNAIIKEILTDWQERFAEDKETGSRRTYNHMMALDAQGITMRTMMQRHLDPYQTGYYKKWLLNDKQRYNIIKWCETMGAATNHYDEAFVSILMHALEFDWPEGDQGPHSGYGVPQNRWWCILGGTETIIPKMRNIIETVPIKVNNRVNRIEQADGKISVTVRVRGEDEQRVDTFSHVIATCTTPCLQTMDLRNAGLSYGQREAIRVLRYDNSVKVGIRFKQRWWASNELGFAGIKDGGVGYTDRPTRVTVYPSYALEDSPRDPGVLLACYNWAQDAARLGHLMQGDDPTKQQAVLDVVLADLAAMHCRSDETGVVDVAEARAFEEKLRGWEDGYHVHDWYHYEHTGGAFGMFGPGQFGALFPHLRQPAATGKLFFAGELTSIYHGWIVASLNSARRAVDHLLLCRAEAANSARKLDEQQLLQDLRTTLKKDWDQPGGKGDMDGIDSEQEKRWAAITQPLIARISRVRAKHTRRRGGKKHQDLGDDLS